MVIMKKHLKSESGFTLVEVLMVVVIIGLIAAIATPNFNSWKRKADLNADMRRFYAFFQQARMEAVKRNSECNIASNQAVNGTTFDYVSFIDSEAPNPNSNNVYDAGEEIIFTGDFTNGITATAPFSASFSRRGLIDSNSRITLLSTNGYQHDLVINIRGRMRIE